MADEQNNETPRKKPEKPRPSASPGSDSDSFHTPLGSGEDLSKYEKPRTSRRSTTPKPTTDENITPTDQKIDPKAQKREPRDKSKDFTDQRRSTQPAESSRKKSVIRPLLDPSGSSSSEAHMGPSVSTADIRKTKKQQHFEQDSTESNVSDRPLNRVSSRIPSSYFIHHGSAISYNPSIFGEGPMRYDDTERRPTITWPEDGCIFIPLRPPENENAEQSGSIAPTRNTDSTDEIENRRDEKKK